MGYKNFKRANLGYKRENDNIYKTGTLISAKVDPNVSLLIRKYIHQTYYCTVVGDAVISTLRYKESDLIPPMNLN